LYGMVSNTPYGTSFKAFKNSVTSKQTISIRDDSNCIDLGYSVADPGGLSRIPDLNFFYPGSRIRDPHQRILFYFNPQKNGF
jgi:hypothetical protein